MLQNVVIYIRSLNLMLMWRNWQTHWTQNPAGNHVGSSPTISTKLKIFELNKKLGIELFLPSFFILYIIFEYNK